MGRGLAAIGLLAALTIPTAAQAQGAKPSKRCDFTDAAVCLFPWPNDFFTKSDKATPTGKRLALKRASMPRNKDGKPIDPADINRADGFSPGSMLITKVRGLDTLQAARRTGLPPIGDLSRSLAKRSPVVVINARTGKRHLVWAEIDSNPRRPSDRVLIIRPGKNFTEGERYIVALRNLRNAGGRKLDAGARFRLYRDGIVTRKRLIERRRAHFESLFRTLKKAGIPRKSLYLAWDFTVASRQSIAGRALHIRDQAFRGLGDTNLRDLEVQGSSPPFTVDLVRDLTPAEDPLIARRIEGTITAPCFITNGCQPGGRFRLDRRGLPRQLGTTQFKYYCNVPRAALDPAAPPKARPSLYGHGLLGNPSEFDASNVKAMSNEHNFVFCATAWAGFAAEDVPNIVSVLSDLSRFTTVADRIQQGFVQQLFLGRALIHPQGLSSNAAFQKNGQSVIDTQRLFFDGNSQGGIMGGALTALAPDFDRAVLGVPGMNYSTLLQRSVDFDSYSPILYGGYPNQLERQLWLSQIQLLWDRGESNGYAQHITSKPLPNTPKHTVLMHVAFGDHQVADFTTSIMARTFGARIRQPALDSGRSPFANPFFGIGRIASFPFAGSAVVWWDTGTPRQVGAETLGTDPPPLTNVPNRAGDDPHSAPRSSVDARVQKSEFLKVGGSVIDVCAARPCYADGWTGAP
ncbi:MAG: hypothetical protein QOH58_819 [Thermoleophilaceae bacterium]|jgi:hypothetical protein|nr:hypothetical protein [Thermoleophilaceae bacterium]